MISQETIYIQTTKIDLTSCIYIFIHTYSCKNKEKRGYQLEWWGKGEGGGRVFEVAEKGGKKGCNSILLKALKRN